MRCSLMWLFSLSLRGWTWAGVICPRHSRLKGSEVRVLSDDGVWPPGLTGDKENPSGLPARHLWPATDSRALNGTWGTRVSRGSSLQLDCQLPGDKDGESHQLAP